MLEVLALIGGDVRTRWEAAGNHKLGRQEQAAVKRMMGRGVRYSAKGWMMWG